MAKKTKSARSKSAKRYAGSKRSRKTAKKKRVTAGKKTSKSKPKKSAAKQGSKKKRKVAKKASSGKKATKRKSSKRKASAGGKTSQRQTKRATAKKGSKKKRKVAKKTTSSGKKAAKRRAGKKSSKSKRATAKKGRKKKAAGGKKRPAKKRTKKTATEVATKKSQRSTESNQFARARRAYLRYAEEIKKLPTVVGLSLGHRFKAGKPVPEMTLRVHVESEKAKQFLRDNADDIGLKREYGGLGVDIVVWNFRSASTSLDLKDGECISGPGGDGTLGTTFVMDVDGFPTTVWMTAAHVASRSIPLMSPSVPMNLCGEVSPIGDVSQSQYFRGPDADAAFVVPRTTQLVDPGGRVLAPPLTTAHLGREVTMNGARTKNSTGRIVSVDYDGPVVSDGGKEPVVDHFHVKGTTTRAFAVPGDSGGLVLLDGQLLGVLRAVDRETGEIACVARFDILRTQLPNLLT